MWDSPGERFRPPRSSTCAVVLSVTVICTDSDCREERELLVESLEQLDEGACDCGYAFVVTRVAEARA